MGRGRKLALAAVLACGCATHRPAALLESAARNQRQGANETALAELRQALEATPESDVRGRAEIHFVIADHFVRLKRDDDAVSAARVGIALMKQLDPAPRMPRRWWYEAFIALHRRDVDGSVSALTKLLGGGYDDVAEFCGAAWLAPVRAHPYYRALVATLVLNAGKLDEYDARLILKAGGIDLRALEILIAAPEKPAGACSLAVVQMRESLGQGPDGRSQVVAEVVNPQVEGDGVEYETRTARASVDTTSNSTAWVGRDVYWGAPLLTAFGVGTSHSTVTRQETVPVNLYSVVLNPQGLFAVYQYEGIDPRLLQNRVAVIFGCAKSVADLPQAKLQRQRVPVLDVIAYSPFEAGGLPVRRAAGEPVLPP